MGRNGLNPADTAWTRGSSLAPRVTLFDFGRRNERATEAAISLREERIRLVDLQHEIDRQIRAARGQVEAARAKVAATQAERELTALQMEQTRVRDGGVRLLLL